MSSCILHSTSHFASRLKEAPCAPAPARMKNPTIASWPLSGPSGIFHYMKQIFGILDDSQRQGLAPTRPNEQGKEKEDEDENY